MPRTPTGHTGLRESVAEIVDAAAGGRVVVVGSTPPHARDLDVLVREPERERIEAALREAGFVGRGHEWARFRHCTADAVDLMPAATWRLPPAALDELFADAVPLDGYERLAAPSPKHDLLVLARLGVPEKRRPRLERALSAPGAWEAALARAPDWGVDLAALREPPRSRAAPRRPRVLALSGIDGSGKSTQAKALRDALERLGYDVAIEWAPISQSPIIGALAAPVKRVLARSRRLAPAAAEQPSGLHRDHGTELRDRSPTVRFVWTTLVAVENALWHARVAYRHALAGRVVVFDRYVLDSFARMRFQYGEQHGYRIQEAIVRLLSPRPRAAFYLEISPELSLERKDDRWTLDELRVQARAYDALADELGVIRLDGRRPLEELCAEIAEAAWRRLA